MIVLSQQWTFLYQLYNLHAKSVSYTLGPESCHNTNFVVAGRRLSYQKYPIQHVPAMTTKLALLQLSVLLNAQWAVTFIIKTKSLCDGVPDGFRICPTTPWFCDLGGSPWGQPGPAGGASDTCVRQYSFRHWFFSDSSTILDFIVIGWSHQNHNVPSM